MTKKKLLWGAMIVITSYFIVSTALATMIDPSARTVTTDILFVDWSDTNPEEIVDIRWNGSSNLTNTAVIGGCPDDLEYFGNSWVSKDEGTPDFVFVSLVGWGTTGSWENLSDEIIKIDSSSAGCPASAEVLVQTKYRFFDRGPVANRIRIQRSFSFGSTPFPYNFRPYIPRLYPSSAYSQVLHPDVSGTNLVTEETFLCDFGCQVTNWDGSWFAIHDPSAGQGLIVRRASTQFEAALWVDQDGASFANASSALLLQPDGGFTGKVVEVEFLCFYDSNIWEPSTNLPPGC
jgi:hypothetical protein